LAGLRTAGLEVLSDLRAGMVVSCTSDVCQPNDQVQLPAACQVVKPQKAVMGRRSTATPCSAPEHDVLNTFPAADRVPNNLLRARWARGNA
jgi:hypothetical protein